MIATNCSIDSFLLFLLLFFYCLREFVQHYMLSRLRIPKKKNHNWRQKCDETWGSEKYRMHSWNLSSVVDVFQDCSVCQIPRYYPRLEFPIFLSSPSVCPSARPRVSLWRPRWHPYSCMQMPSRSLPPARPPTRELTRSDPLGHTRARST